MKTSHVVVGGLAVAALGYVAWLKLGRGAAVSNVRNDASGPRLPSLRTCRRQARRRPTRPSRAG